MPVTTADDAYLAAKAVSKGFRGTRVLEELDLSIGRGEFVSLLGPSGCGKTTLLRLVAGLLAADSGTITLGGHLISNLPPHKRNVGVVFQNYALFPHLSVFDNVAFGLRARKLPAAEIKETVGRFLELVKLADYADRHPVALSGGQQQRVAVARALAPHPDILLLDEPFSALDRKLREGMQIELRALLRELGITAVFVTHDQDEALVMSDRIAVMHKGLIEQFDVPEQIYANPRTRFVLDFIGASSKLAGTVAAVEGDLLSVSVGESVVRTPGHFRKGADVVVAARPEHIQISSAAETDGARNSIPVRLSDRIYIGARTSARFVTENGSGFAAELPPERAAGLAVGETYFASWDVAKTMIFPGEA